MGHPDPPRIYFWEWRPALGTDPGQGSRAKNCARLLRCCWTVCLLAMHETQVIPWVYGISLGPTWKQNPSPCQAQENESIHADYQNGGKNETYVQYCLLFAEPPLCNRHNRMAEPSGRVSPVAAPTPGCRCFCRQRLLSRM